MTQAMQAQNTPLTITEEASLKSSELILEEKEIIFFKKWLIAHCVNQAGVRQMNFPVSQLMSNWLFWLSQESDLKVRVSIVGGGCHGFQYRFTLANQTNVDDTVIQKTVTAQDKVNEKRTATWLIDMISINFLRGAVVDYKSDAQGERFILRGLKAKTTCSCGSSFDADFA